MKYFTKSFLYYQQGHKSLNIGIGRFRIVARGGGGCQGIEYGGDGGGGWGGQGIEYGGDGGPKGSNS